PDVIVRLMRMLGDALAKDGDGALDVARLPQRLRQSLVGIARGIELKRPFIKRDRFLQAIRGAMDVGEAVEGRRKVGVKTQDGVETVFSRPVVPAAEPRLTEVDPKGQVVWGLSQSFLQDRNGL